MGCRVWVARPMVTRPNNGAHVQPERWLREERPGGGDAATLLGWDHADARQTAGKIRDPSSIASISASLRNPKRVSTRGSRPTYWEVHPSPGGGAASPLAGSLDDCPLSQIPAATR